MKTCFLTHARASIIKTRRAINLIQRQDLIYVPLRRQFMFSSHKHKKMIWFCVKLQVGRIVILSFIIMIYRQRKRLRIQNMVFYALTTSWTSCCSIGAERICIYTVHEYFIHDSSLKKYIFESITEKIIQLT